MVPKLRFYRFLNNDEYKWQSKKITDISKTFIGLVTTMTSSYVDNGVKLIRNSDIKENYVEKSKLIKLDISFAEQYGSRKLKSGDVVTVHTGDIGVSAVIDEELDGCLGFATLNTRPNPTIINSKYLCQYFNSPYNIKYALSMATGDGRSNYNLKDFNNAIIPVPCIDEQTKIADFLFSVDEKIALLNKQYNLLSQYKKGMMQKIFSQEVRFKDENGEEFPEWNSCQLKDVATRVTRKNKENNQTILTISGRDGLVDQMSYFNKQIASKNVIGYYLINNGEFAYNKSYSQGYPMGAIKMLTNYDRGVVSTLYICFKLNTNQSNSFFQHYFESGLQNRSIEKVAQEGARNHGLLNIGVNDFFDIELQIPSLKEQIKISDYLSALDDKIAVKKAELDKLKAWKQGLLQQMFV